MTLSKDPFKKKEFTLTKSNFCFSSSTNKLSSINKIKSLFKTNKNKAHVSKTNNDATTTLNPELEKQSSNSFKQTLSADDRENLQKWKNNLQFFTEKLTTDIPVKKKNSVFDRLGLSKEVSPFLPLSIMKHKTAETKEQSSQSLTIPKEVIANQQKKFWKSKIPDEKNNFGPYRLENIPSSNFEYKGKNSMNNKKNKQTAQIHFMKVKI